MIVILVKMYYVLCCVKKTPSTVSFNHRITMLKSMDHFAAEQIRAGVWRHLIDSLVGGRLSGAITYHCG